MGMRWASVSLPSKAQEEECFIFTEAFLSAGSLISLTHFWKPCCGLDLWSGERPLGAGAGVADPPVSPATERSTIPSDVLLGEASLDTPRGWCQGPKDSDQRRTTLLGSSFGSQDRALHYATASSFLSLTAYSTHSPARPGSAADPAGGPAVP